MKAKRSAKIITIADHQKRNLAHVKRDRGYRWNDRDPILEKLCEIITNSGLSAREISQRVATSFGSPVAATTIYHWQSGRTRKPQNYTMDRVAFVLGKTRGSEWTDLK